MEVTKCVENRVNALDVLSLPQLYLRFHFSER